MRFCTMGESSDTGPCWLAATVWCPQHGDICAAHEVLYHERKPGCRSYGIDWSVQVYPTAACAVATCPNHQPPGEREHLFPLCPAHESIFD